MDREICLRLPAWVAETVENSPAQMPSVEERMRWVIGLARRNVAEKTGGPFGAAVFEMESGAVVAAGVNIVVPAQCSLAHAEAMALMMAQQCLHTYDLGAEGLPALELVTSAQPCIQCYGNVWWSGVRRLVTGASKDDVEVLTGFQEGPVPDDWAARLESRSPMTPVKVLQGILQAEARTVLAAYREYGGAFYSPS